MDTGRQSSGPARRGGYSVKTVRELSVGRPCVTLGFVLRETVSRITYRNRHGTANVGRCTPSPAHHVLIIRRRNTRMIIGIDLPAGPLGIVTALRRPKKAGGHIGNRGG